MRNWAAVGFALLLIVPLALAQDVPPSGPTVALEGPSGATTSVDDPGSLTLTVRNTASSTGSPLDELLGMATAGDVVMSVAGLPDGWTVVMEPSAFTLAGGAAQTVTATISVAPGSNADSAELRFIADMTSQDPTGVLAPPTQDIVVVPVERDDSVTRALLETLGPAVWVLFAVVLIALAVTAFLIVDQRTRIVGLTGPGGEVRLGPGATASIPFRVENRGKNEDRIVVHAHCGDEVWVAELPVGQTRLAPGSAADLHVAVTAPKDAPPESRAVVRIVAVADQAPKKITVLALAILVEAAAKK